LFQLRYENFSESYPKFRSYKIRVGQQIQQYVFHKNLKEVVDYAQDYAKYKHIFLLDESRFHFFRTDIYQDFDEKFTLEDLHKIIKYQCDMQKKKHKLNWEKIVSYIDTIFVDGESKNFVIGETWSIFFRLYLVYIQSTTLNTFNSFYGDTLKASNISLVPQSFHSLLFLRNTLKKENFIMLNITDTYCKAIQIENWFYHKVELLNLGTTALKQMYKDNNIMDYRNKSYEQIEANTLAKNLVIQTLWFYIKLLCKRLFDQDFTGLDVVLTSSIIKNWHFLELFNTEYGKYSNNYIVPFHHSDKIQDYGQTREAEDMDALIYINRKKLYTE